MNPPSLTRGTALTGSTARGAAAAFLLTAAASAQTLDLQLRATLPALPTAVEVAPGVTHQLYVATKEGRIWVVRGGTTLQTPFLDLRAMVEDTGGNGLLGFAFHPDFQANGRLYVSYTAAPGVGASLVSEFRTLPGSVDQADPMTERVIVGPVPQQAVGHRGGDLAFGPDGLLIVALGDGDPSTSGTLGTAQALGDLRGKLLRVDVDSPAPHVPAGNPYVGVPGANPLVWALGLRNPWRLDVDPVTGDVYVGDVGNSNQEEVTRIPAGGGGANLGWPCREGRECRPSNVCTCPDPTFLDPFATLVHSSTSPICAIIGGVVLRGSDIPRLEGHYIFSDFCTGRLWVVEDPAGTPTVVDVTAEFGGAGPLTNVSVLAQGPAGELLIASHYSGELWQVVPRPGFQVFCDAAPNSAGPGAAIGAQGSPSIAAANLTLGVTGLPPAALGFFLASEGRAFEPGFGGSQGNLCLAPPIRRWSARVQAADAQGAVSMNTDLADLPPPVVPGPGRTWNFQYWTRDANPGATSNTSDAVAVTFAP